MFQSLFRGKCGRYAVPVAAVSVVAGYFLTSSFLHTTNCAQLHQSVNPHAASVTIPGKEAVAASFPTPSSVFTASESQLQVDATRKRFPY